MKTDKLTLERKMMIIECLSERGRYKNCSLRTRLGVLKARIIWFLIYRWV